MPLNMPSALLPIPRAPQPVPNIQLGQRLNLLGTAAGRHLFDPIPHPVSIPPARSNLLRQPANTAEQSTNPDLLVTSQTAFASPAATHDAPPPQLSTWSQRDPTSSPQPSPATSGVDKLDALAGRGFPGCWYVACSYQRVGVHMPLRVRLRRSTCPG